MNQVVEDLGCYVLPGKAPSPVVGVEQAIEAERIGLGAVWASERWEAKESGALLGAIANATSRIRLVTGTTHFGTRHPMVLAGMAAPLQGLSGGRFEIGVARSVVERWKKIGAPAQTNQSMADMVSILKRLWAGETVSYSGPAGEFPEMLFADLPDKSTPIHLAAVGPKTLALAGAHFDGVILHPFLTPEGVARSAAIVREAAPDLTPEETKAAVYVRATTYFVHKEMATPILKANGWDLKLLDPILATGLENLEMQQVSLDVLRAKMAEASALIPPTWISEGSAVGSAATVAARLMDYKAAGADEILLHGATADKLEGLVNAYRQLREG